MNLVVHGNTIHYQYIIIFKWHDLQTSESSVHFTNFLDSDILLFWSSGVHPDLAKKQFRIG